ncbi:MAG: hypothetical protein AAFR79_08975, partial [Pseudomonadota bacterium]
HVKGFNATLRDELLGGEIFDSLREAAPRKVAARTHHRPASLRTPIAAAGLRGQHHQGRPLAHQSRWQPTFDLDP